MKWIMNIASCPKGHKVHNEKEEIQILHLLICPHSLVETQNHVSVETRAHAENLTGKDIQDRKAGKWKQESQDMKKLSNCGQSFNWFREPSSQAIFILLFLPNFLFYSSLSFPFICYREEKIRMEKVTALNGQGPQDFFPSSLHMEHCLHCKV